MSLKYGDAVVLVQQSRDGEITRVNAIVLDSAVQPSNVDPRQALKDSKGVLAEGEHLEVVFPRQFPGGQPPKTRDMDVLFQRAVGVAPWKDGAWIGWQPGSATAVAPEAAPALPSAEDLDADAADKKAAEATSGGKVRVIKGK